MNLLNLFTIILPLISLIIFGNFQFDQANAQESSNQKQNRWPVINDCSICLSSFAQNDVTTLKNCGHMFYSKCIEKWIRNNKNSCPCCRESNTKEDIIKVINELTVSGQNNLTVQNNNENGNVWRSVFADLSISNSFADGSSKIFYFEILVKNMKNFPIFGFAVKHPTPLNEEITNQKATYAYGGNGILWLNGLIEIKTDEFGIGETVGFGVYLANRQLFFTKNGKQIDPTDLSISFSYQIAEHLFPFVSLFDNGDEIETNFGPNFQFDIANLKINGECSICSSGFDQNDVKALKYCGHTFHSECIEKWITTSDNCPICGTLIKQQNWDANKCHNDLTISGLTVRRNGNDTWRHRSVFAELNISDSANSSKIFYFEITVKKKIHLFALGIAIKHQAPLDNTSLYYREGTYAYDIDGTLWLDGIRGNVYAQFRNGNTVGFGVNLITNKLFFTKNGKQISFTNFEQQNGPIDLSISFSDHSADQFFPFVSLYSIGDEIEANFGSKKFKFDLATLN